MVNFLCVNQEKLPQVKNCEAGSSIMNNLSGCTEGKGRGGGRRTANEYDANLSGNFNKLLVDFF
jgi:hypothetical protein